MDNTRTPTRPDVEPLLADEDVIEPDYRFTLANERTFLAWQRTALGLLAAAVAIVQFLPDLTVPALRHTLGVIVGALALLTAGVGLRRWNQVDHAMRRSRPLPRPSGPAALTTGLVVAGLITVAVVIISAAAGQ
jgi:putative membrane protein